MTPLNYLGKCWSCSCWDPGPPGWSRGPGLSCWFLECHYWIDLETRPGYSKLSLLLLLSPQLTEILDIVVETRGEAQQASPAAVGRGELTGAEERITETFSSHCHHQAVQYEGQQSHSGYGKIGSIKALAYITGPGVFSSWGNTRWFWGHFEKAFCSTSRSDETDEYGTDLCWFWFYSITSMALRTHHYSFFGGKIWKFRMNKMCVYISACGALLGSAGGCDSNKVAPTVFFYLIWADGARQGYTTVWPPCWQVLTDWLTLG